MKIPSPCTSSSPIGFGRFQACILSFSRSPPREFGFCRSVFGRALSRALALVKSALLPSSGPVLVIPGSSLPVVSPSESTPRPSGSAVLGASGFAPRSFLFQPGRERVFPSPLPSSRVSLGFCFQNRGGLVPPFRLPSVPEESRTARLLLQGGRFSAFPLTLSLQRSCFALPPFSSELRGGAWC